MWKWQISLEITAVTTTAAAVTAAAAITATAAITAAAAVTAVTAAAKQQCCNEANVNNL